MWNFVAGDKAASVLRIWYSSGFDFNCNLVVDTKINISEFSTSTPGFWFFRKPQHTQLDSMYSINLTRSYKIVSSREQAMKMAANDVSDQGLQSALRNMHQNIFSRKL